jgi:enterochelin esterase-like enzyme
MDAKPAGRLLTGHSSGGWATLQLQINYAQIFGGTWSTSPDPCDFEDFLGTNIYAPNANVYRKPDGSPRPLVRVGGKVIATFEQIAKISRLCSVRMEVNFLRLTGSSLLEVLMERLSLCSTA